jgi:hypothetical protein
MTSLTRVSIAARKIIRYGIFFLIFLIVARVLFDIGKGIYLKLFPPPPPAATVKFGKLTKISFPLKARPNVTLTLETAEGTLPKFPIQAKVYFMPKTTSNLLSLDVAKQAASGLGFRTDGQAVNSTMYKFQSQNGFATLDMNIITEVFSISYNLKADPSPIEKRPPAPEIAASIVRSFLSGANLLPSDLTGEIQSEFLKIEGENLVPALSLSDANLVKIYFFRKSYDNYPSLTAEPNKGNVWFLVSGSQETGKKIIAGEYHYFSVDESQLATYPIKTSQEAWNELSQGGGYIASMGTNNDGSSVKIRKVYLAYFDSGTYTQFFQPIAVFEGDNGFVAYLPIVTDSYYSQ